MGLSDSPIGSDTGQPDPATSTYLKALLVTGLIIAVLLLVIVIIGGCLSNGIPG